MRAQRIGPAAGATARTATRFAAAGSSLLLPVAFIHLPTLSTSGVNTSAAFVSHVGGLMVGRRLPSPSYEELLVAAAGGG